MLMARSHMVLVGFLWRDNCGGRSAAIMMAGIRRRRVVDFDYHSVGILATAQRQLR